MRAASLVGRGRPYYVLDDLRIDAAFASTTDAQDVRQKVADGVIDSMSIVFRGQDWEDIDGVRTCVRGELLAADLVSISSNARARILTMRSLQQATIEQARQATIDATLALARAQIADAKRLLPDSDDDADHPTRTEIRTFLRSL